MLPYPAFDQKKAFDKDGKTRRIYGTLGDSFLQERIVSSLIEWALPDAEARDFNLETLDGETSGVTDVLAGAGSLPFLAEARVVHVRRAERLDNINRSAAQDDDETDAKSDKGKISPAKRLAEGLKNLPSTTVLILSRTAETPEPGARAATPRCINAAIDKVIEDKAVGGLIVDCTIGAKASSLAMGVLGAEAEKRGIAFEPRALSHLVERGGHDIAYLLQELEKCSLRVGANQTVTAQVVDEMTRRTLQETIFDLMDALGERRGPRAIALLRELMENGHAPQPILANMTSHFRFLLQARAFLDAGLKLDAGLSGRLPPEMARQLPQDGRYNLATMFSSQAWRAGKFGVQARNFQTPQLQRALQAALKVASDSPSVLRLHVYMLLKQGRLSEALTVLKLGRPRPVPS